MALRNILKDNDPTLKKVCRPVEKFDSRLQTLLDDMAETMMEANGLGLAGPQVGVLKRVFIMAEEASLPPEDATEEEAAAYQPVIVEFINPEILSQEGSEAGYEGCLSFPGQYGAIKRPTAVKVRAQDRNGEFFEYEAQGLMARCVCHENNHLEGVTIRDLAEYYYDPDVPHELDATLYADDEDE